jgi:CRP-like cAMP-binding protein
MDFTLLQKAPLFNRLRIDEIEKILSEITYRIRKFKAGSLIVNSGEQVKSLMIVIKGIVKGEMVDYAGKVIKIEDIPAPGSLASGFMFGNRNLYPVNVTSVTESELLVIDKNTFLNLLIRHDLVLVNFLDMISNRSQFLSEKIKFLNFKTIRGKLAQYILQAAGSDKYEIILDMTQNEMAEYFGVARPSIGRVISELEEEGIISTKGKYLKILDRKKLSELTIE